MKTIEITLYKFAELSEEAQQTALNNLSDINIGYDWWDSTYEDARNIGLKITESDFERFCKGYFIHSAKHTADLIIENHGESCETYTTAVAFLAGYDNVINEEEEGSIEEEEEDFLNSLLEDYRIMLQNEYEYQTSTEAIIEAIEANDYDFTEEGELYL